MWNPKVENILDLPNEMLQHILLFVPNRRNVALVCRRMYEIVCANKSILRTVMRFNEDEFNKQILPSIMNTKRKIDEIHLVLPSFMITKQIISEFGKYIKKVKFMMRYLQLNLDEFVELTTLMPNLQQIRFDTVNTLKIDSKSMATVLSLPKLRSISVTSQDELIIFAKMLPKNILEELLVDCGFTDYGSPTPLEEMLEKQKTVRKLRIPTRPSCSPSIDVMRELKLSYLTYCIQPPEWEMRHYLKELLKYQPNLLYLNLMNYEVEFLELSVDSLIMKIICKMENLETLLMNIDGVGVDAVSHFQNLKKLKYFEIMTYSQQSLLVLENLSLLENFPIETFVINIPRFEIPALIYQQMGRNFKYFKHLTIRHNSIHKINFFLESFPNLESLNLTLQPKSDTSDSFLTIFSETFDVYIDNRTFPKLRMIKLLLFSKKPDQNQIDMLKRIIPNATYFEIKAILLG